MSGVKVERVDSERGSSLVPPFKDSWSDLRKLEWHAAVATLDGGMQVAVEKAKYSSQIAGIWRRNPGYFNVIVGQWPRHGSVVGPMDFSRAWTFINGVACAGLLFNRSQSKSSLDGQAFPEGSTN